MDNGKMRFSGIIECGRYNLDLSGRTLVMGILNVTPDSFSDGGKFFDKDSAIEHGIKMAEDGVDIIDVGGESTRPGAEAVDSDEQIRRVVPVIRELRKRVDVPISIDTRLSEVAKASLDAGADIINDVSGLRDDGKLAELASERKVPVILMHMKGCPKTMQSEPYYEDTVGEIKRFLAERIEFAIKSGIDKEKIIIDVGIGFGKRLEDNYVLIDNIEEFYDFGVAVLVGHSRKSFIRKSVDVVDVKESDDVTLSVSGILAYKKVHILRVHNVRSTRLACEMIERLTRGSMSIK